MIHLFTHDSIGLGEDGPTHQPVEQLASLRAIPGLDVIRPADANEVAEAWRVAIDRTHQPVALVLTRQNVPILDRSNYASAEGLRRGGYVLADAEGGDPEVILIATGSEVALALAAHEKLIAEGIRSRVVSLPCWELFDRQDQAYRDEVLPPGIQPRVSIEEASTLGWDRYVGPEGVSIGMHTFGTSAPLKDVQTKLARRRVEQYATIAATCSGARYPAVPSTVPGAVSASAPVVDAIPKSETCTLPSSSRRRFAGFTSRWTTPFSCARSIATAACSSQASAVPRGIRPRCMRSNTEPPSRYSMTMSGRPRCSATSKTLTTFGAAESRAAASASRRKRALASSWLA